MKSRTQKICGFCDGDVLEGFFYVSTSKKDFHEECYQDYKAGFKDIADKQFQEISMRDQIEMNNQIELDV